MVIKRGSTQLEKGIVCSWMKNRGRR
jgi:hypothetical protein